MKILFFIFTLLFINQSMAIDTTNIKNDIEKTVSKEVEKYITDKIEEKKKESKLYQIIVKVFNIIRSILVGIKNFIIKVLRLILGPFVNGRKPSVFLYR